MIRTSSPIFIIAMIFIMLSGQVYSASGHSCAAHTTDQQDVSGKMSMDHSTHLASSDLTLNSHTMNHSSMGEQSDSTSVCCDDTCFCPSACGHSAFMMNTATLASAPLINHANNAVIAFYPQLHLRSLYRPPIFS